jgi:hypothetical protein
MCQRMVAQRNDPAFERERIESLLSSSMPIILDDLTSMGSVDSFRFLSVALLDRDFPKIETYKQQWREAAAHQVWYKYNR